MNTDQLRNHFIEGHHRSSWFTLGRDITSVDGITHSSQWRYQNDPQQIYRGRAEL